MTETATPETSAIEQNLVVVRPGYELTMRPGVTRHEEFWSSSDAKDRTFYALADPSSVMKFLVVPESDPRSQGMRLPSGSELDLMRQVGLAEGHRVWTISTVELESVTRIDLVQSEPEPTPAGALQVGDWFTWGGKTMWHRAASIEAGRVQTDAQMSQSRSGRGLVVEPDHWRIAGLSDLEFHRPDSPDLPDFLREALVDPMPTSMPDVPVESADSDSEDSVVRDLRLRLEAAGALLRQTQAKHEQDILLIGNILIEECERRDWCTEYEEVLEPLNVRLTYALPMPYREREHEVELTITYTITTRVMAKDEEEAEEKAIEGFSSSDVQYTTPDDITAGNCREV